MKGLTKKILTGLIAGTLIFSGVGEVSAEPNQKQTEEQINSWVKGTSAWSGVSEKEIQNAIQEGKSYEDINFAAMLSKISGKSLNQILSMKSDWFDVMKKLGITREKYESTLQEMMIKDIAASAELDEATVKNLLANHYHPRDIRIAGRFAKACGKNVQEILDMKKINQRWIDIADELKVDKNLIRPRNPMEEEEEEQSPENQNPPDR